MSTPSPWTMERDAEVRRRWMEGETAQEIADALGRDISRAAVIGKVHRLGLAKRKVPTGPRTMADHSGRKGTARKAPPVAQQPLPQTPPSPPVAMPRPRGLERAGCRWPMGDPGTPGFHSCDIEPVSGRPYCAPHCRKAGLPDTPKMIAVMGRCAEPYRFRRGER